MNDRSFKRTWCPLLAGAGLLMLAHSAALLFRIHPAVSLWFPPSGVAITLAIWFGPVAAIVTGLVSTLMAPLWGSYGWMQWVGWTDAIEPLIVWWLYQRLWQRPLTLERLRDVSTFILSAPVFACAASAIVGSSTLAMLGKGTWLTMLEAIPHWWLGNAIGTMAITPIALLTLTPILQRYHWIPASPQSTCPLPQQSNSSRLRTEKLTIVCLCLAIALLSVSQTSSTGFAFQQFAFLNFLPILWAALRFGAIGGVGTASLCVIATLLSYILKYPQAIELSNFPVAPSVLTIHKLSLLTQCVIGLLLGTAITQQTQAQVNLATSQVQLAEYEARSRLNEILEQTNQALAATNLQLEQTNREKDELLKREQAARSQAEAANRIKDDFLAVVSHELRSPLNPILGWATLLQSGKLDATATQKALETISRNAGLQAQLIEDLLDVSRILRGKLALNAMDLDLGLVIRSAIETVRLSAEAKAISLTFTPVNSESGILVHGDPNRLQQVLVNLLTNAIKFTPQNGQVTITVDYSSYSAQALSEHAGSVKISISDTGKGIHPDFLPYVFERFRQEDSGTTRNFGGLGLGLAIVRHLVELHHGQVEAKSEGINRGATFMITLPMVQSGSKAQVSDVAPAVPPTPGFLKDRAILIVDDDADTRELLQYVLKVEGAMVSLAASAQDAIAQMQSLTPDLVISDLNMPGMDGYQFIHHIRSTQTAPIPAIAVTANVREQDRLSAIAAGFDAHLTKPIILEVLLAEIEKQLHLIHSISSL